MKKFILIVMCAILSLGLFSCGTPSPTETANTFLQALKESDQETIKTVYSEGALDILKEVQNGEMESSDVFDKQFTDDFKKKVLSFEYEVTNEKIDGDKATVDVAIKTYDLGKAFTGFVQEYIQQAIGMSLEGASEEKINQLATDIFSKKVKEMKMDYEKTVKLSLSKKDDAWVIDKLDPEGDFYNALTGGMVDAMKALGESFNS